MVTQVQGAYQTWRRRPLGEDRSTICSSMDSGIGSARGGHVAWCSVLMALGVRTTGEKVVLGLRAVGDERGTSC